MGGELYLDEKGEDNIPVKNSFAAESSAAGDPPTSNQHFVESHSELDGNGYNIVSQ